MEFHDDDLQYNEDAWDPFFFVVKFEILLDQSQKNKNTVNNNQ